MEEALGRMTGTPPRLSVAGRTDAGVHAEGQVASFEAPRELDPERAQRALNGMRAPEVVVRRATRARSGFDARHSATGREYRYRIDTGLVPSPFTARFTWHRPVGLDIDGMRAAATLLLGEHDFASFCRTPPPPGSTVRTLRRLDVRPRRSGIEVVAQADSFLHQMVRSLVGTLVAVGQGRIDSTSMPDILGSASRAAAGPVAPPHGLTLTRVFYSRQTP